MGRKIPGRKHHGVRDPEKQQEERFKSLKDKINNPPVDADDQQIPKSLKRLQELRERVKSGKIKKKKTNKKPVRIPRLEGESDKRFIYRVSQICENVKREAAFENKYNVEIKRKPDGEVECVVKRPDDPVTKMLKEAKKWKNEKQKKKTDAVEQKLTKAQKKKEKLLAKRQKKFDNNLDEFKDFQDHIKFGEQVHAPPTLSVIPRKAAKTENVAPRPGTKDLLLKSLMEGKEVKPVVKKTIDKKGKRKDLPNAMRRQLEQQQNEVIEAYKAMKIKK